MEYNDILYKNTYSYYIITLKIKKQKVVEKKSVVCTPNLTPLLHVNVKLYHFKFPGMIRLQCSPRRSRVPVRTREKTVNACVSKYF